jgi:hypothetical protein
MSDEEEFYVRHEVSYEDDEYNEERADSGPDPNDSVFDNEFRILVLANSSITSADDGNTQVSVEQSDMEEILVRQVRTLDDVNEFFDEFDKLIAEPNEGHLKYEVGSDGLCVVLVDTVELKGKVVEFVQKFIDSHDEKVTDKVQTNSEDNDNEERNVKRRR